MTTTASPALSRFIRSDWVCPSCERPLEKRKVVVHHEHLENFINALAHDASKVGNKLNDFRLLTGLIVRHRRFPPTFICEDCNGLEGHNLKKVHCAHRWFYSCQNKCSVSGRAMVPKEENCFTNLPGISGETSDAAALADLYSDGATNHQVTHEPIVGKTAIKAMFEREFAAADMTCIVETIHEAGEVAALEWRDPLGIRGCGFFPVRDDRITIQRGYWDKLSFLRMHNLPIE